VSDDALPLLVQAGCLAGSGESDELEDDAADVPTRAVDVATEHGDRYVRTG
jgi:hypothetical protein